MKSNLIRIMLGVALLALISQTSQAAVSVSISTFQTDLDPYGSWVDVPSYGACWAPARVSSSWQPYTVGRWIYTDYGWTWVSDDPWGGTPYHYGTWVRSDGYGWVWIPGTVWAPAWVTWSYSDSYIGWAPISPSLDIGYSGYGGPAIVVSQTNYVFVPVNRFVGSNVSSVRVPRQQNAAIFQQTRQRTTNFGVSNGILVNRGPSVQHIEQVAHTRVPRENVSAARVTPAPISAGGQARGGRLGVTASSSVRASQIHATKGGPAKGEPAGAGGPKAVGGTQHREATGHATAGEATSSHQRSGTVQERKATASEPRSTTHEKKTAPQGGAVHERPSHSGSSSAAQERRAPVQEHRPAPAEHKASVQEKKAPPPEHRATHEPKVASPPPPSREVHREAPPPPPPSREVHRESPPPPPPSHEASPQGRPHGGPPPERSKPQQQPKKKEEPPPPPHG